MLLAVETSASVGSIALMDDGRLIAECQLAKVGHRHAQTLVAELDRLLKQHAFSTQAIRHVAVSIGPGSFTGLRVGLVFAKTFAWLNHTSLLAVDTLQAIAQQAPAEHEIVTAACDAQRGELFAASYRLDPVTGFRNAISPTKVVHVDTLPDSQPVCGPLSPALRDRVSLKCLMLPDSCGMPQASTVALIGTEMLKAEQLSQPDSLEPVYIRVSYAEEKRPATNVG